MWPRATIININILFREKLPVVPDQVIMAKMLLINKILKYILLWW